MPPDHSSHPVPHPIPAALPLPAQVNALSRLLPIALAVFVGFLTIGLPLPILPLHLHDALGMGTLAVGIVVGAQFAAALLSRGLGRSRGRHPGFEARRRHGPLGRGRLGPGLPGVAGLCGHAGHLGGGAAAWPGAAGRG